MDSAGYYHLNRPHYKLQVNDILSITVRSYSDEANKAFNQSTNQNIGAGADEAYFFLTGYTVAVDGNIEVPVLGKVSVLGLTIEEIQEVFQSRLNQYFQEGAVIAHVQLAGIRFTVVGDVLQPGRYVIYQSQVNIFEALASAGDVTLVGDRRQVQIIRQFPEGARLYDLDLTRQSAIRAGALAPRAFKPSPSPWVRWLPSCSSLRPSIPSAATTEHGKHPTPRVQHPAQY
jgi:polysaccharide export outer membrane protein